MVVEEIKLLNFRNFKEERVIFKKGLNVIYGENGQGKTNILEAIFYGLCSHSFRRAQGRDLVREGSGIGVVVLEIEGSTGGARVARQVGKDGSIKTKINGKEGTYRARNVVCYSQEDLWVVKGEPQRRRDFIDDILVQAERDFEDEAGRYRKALQQRNELLKRIRSGEAAKEELEVWEEILAETGERIVAMRMEALSLLERKVDEIVRERAQARFTAKYYSTAADRDALRERLKRGREKEIARGLTLVGPHRDEIAFGLNGKNLRTRGSQGQQRMAILLLKLCGADIIEERLKERGPVLMDDFSSELDQENTSWLIDMLSREGQAILTVNSNRVDDFKGKGWFIRVSEGRVEYGL